MKKMKKLISMFLMMTMLLIISPYFMGNQFAKAAQTTNENHWASEKVNKWAAAGIIDNAASFKANLDITINRGMFASLMSRVSKYTESTTQSFYDVPRNIGYANDIYRAVAAGVLKGYDSGEFRPYAPISRQEAAIVICRGFGLKPMDVKAASRFNDYYQIPEWSKEAISTLAENKYVNGKPGNLFAPEAAITYAEAITMIDNVMGDIINTQGTYTGIIEKNLSVCAPNVNLKDMAVRGSLFILQGVGNEEIFLQNVTISGNLYVLGGGENSVYLENTLIDGVLFADKKDGKVRVVAKGATKVNEVKAYSGVTLEEENLSNIGFEGVQLAKEMPRGSQVDLNGAFSNVTIEAPGAKVTTYGGNIGLIEMKTTAKDTALTLNGDSLGEIKSRAKTSITLNRGTVDKIELQNNTADSKVTVQGESTIKTLEILARAKVNINQGKVTTFNVDEKAGGAEITLQSGGSISMFNVRANALVTGPGKVYTANVYAENVNFEQKPNKISYAPGVTAEQGAALITDTTSLTASTEVLAATIQTPAVGYCNTLAVSFNRPLSANTLSITNSSELLKKIFYKGVPVLIPSNDGTVSWSGTFEAPVATIRIDNTYFEVDKTIELTFSPGAVTDLAGESISFDTKFSTTLLPSTAGTLVLQPSTGVAGATNQSITLVYSPGEALVNGTVVFTLPAALLASSSTDTVSIAGGSASIITTDQITNYGQKVTVSGINTNAFASVALTLNARTIPSNGIYSFSATSDADGTSIGRMSTPGTGDEAKSFYSSPAMATTAGTLTVTPSSPVVASTQDVKVIYTLGSQTTYGSVVFTLPSAFSASSLNDTVSIAGASATPLLAGQITNSGTKVSLYGITGNEGQTVTLNLNSQPIPAVALYTFSAVCDADGAGTKTATAGTGDETATIYPTTYSSGNTPVTPVIPVTPITPVTPVTPVTATTAGTLTVTPSVPIVGTTQDVSVSYMMGGSLSQGSVIFTLPPEFSATVLNDTVSVQGSDVYPLLSGEDLDSDTLSSLFQDFSGRVTNNGTTVSIYGVSRALGDVTLHLNSHEIPAQGSYIFSAVCDADGAGSTKTPTTGTGNEIKTIYTSLYSYVTAPVASPAAGIITNGGAVSLTTTTSGATIYYTTDGSVPNATKNVYTTPIPITSNTTIKAIAILSGLTDSEILTATYTTNALAVPNVVAVDEGNDGNAWDIYITIYKVEDETKITGYRFIYVKESKTLTLAEANALSADRYREVEKSGYNMGVAAYPDAVDSDGDLIVPGNYKIYVMTVADGIHTSYNALSTPVNVTLSESED